MRIIFLNVCRGKIEDKLLEFIKVNSLNTDIFCFQELNKKIVNKIKMVLPGFDLIYNPKKLWIYQGEPFDTAMGIFIKTAKFKAMSSKKVSTSIGSDDEPEGLMQLTDIKNGVSRFMLANIHGKVYPGNKLDTPERIKQSKTITRSTQKFTLPKIIGGDFNLMPNTKSVEILEEQGFKNLIKEFKISSTRNKIAWRQFPEYEKQYFADYVFVSPEIRVTDFRVPNLEISDHLPLILDFEV